MGHNPIQIIIAALAKIEERETLMGSRTATSGPTIGLSTSTQVALFTGRPVHIPDEEGGSFKTETVVYDGPGGTIKLNYWSKKDPRPDRHNHPWKDEDGVSFVSYILQGGYTETVEYVIDGETRVEQRVYRAGDKNTAMWAEFHTVDEVLPDTVTLMVCGPRYTPPEGKSHAWGYRIDNEFVPANAEKVADPTFFPRFLAINPHRRK